MSVRQTRHSESVFLNVPYDRKYEPLFLAFIAGVCGFGLVPRATVEIPGNLNRIIELIGQCAYSFHDLSRVTLDRTPPPTPRFNMPFELGLAVAKAASRRNSHQWLLFESKAHRLGKSLSDVDGTDPYIHDGTPEGVLRALTNALVSRRKSPNLSELEGMYAVFRRAAAKRKKELRGASLFEARAFTDLVLLALDIGARGQSS